MPALPHTTWLRAFDAAARTSSFSAAADELHLTPAAISQQIKLLEQHLGVQLFNRLPRGVSLTDIGHAYAQPIRKGFADMQDATSRLFSGESKRRVRVRASVSYATLILAPMIANFAKAHPDIELQLTTSVWSDRIEEDVDVEIRYGYGDWAEKDIRHLGHQFGQIVCHPNLFAQLGPTATLADYASHAVLIIGTEVDWQEMAKINNDSLPDSFGLMRADTSALAIELLRGGMGAAIVAEAFAQRDIADGRLVAPLPMRLPLARSFFAVTPDNLRDRPEVQRFCDWLEMQHKVTDPKAHGTN